MQKQINNLTANNDKLYARIKALEVQFKYKETVIEEKDNQNQKFNKRLQWNESIILI